MKYLFFLYFFILPTLIFSQINDDFEDGDISGWTESTASYWEASNLNPINGTYSLHQSFDNSSGDHDQISIPFGSFDITSQTTSWRFQIRHEYAPSSSNNWACFLFSDDDASQMYPSGTANGYAVGVNYSGSDDMIKIWKITSGGASEILNTNYDWQTNIGTSTAPGIEVLRTASGNWSVFIDENGGFDNLVQLGTSVTNTDFVTSSYSGFYYEYSSAQDRKLYFDDFLVGIEVPDIDPPFITQITPVTNNTLTVDFNENLDQTTAETISNYSVDGSIGNPTLATLNAGNHKQVQLTFSGTFTDNTNYTLTVNNVEDLSGNPTVNETANFSFVQIAAIFASPTSANTLDVLFNKTVDPTTAQNTVNYSVDGGIGNPTSAVVDGTDDKLVHLSFASDFILEQNYILSVSNVEDTSGNVILTANLPFNYYVTQPFDIVINEIMCDINPPPEVLPAKKYIEIYNNSSYPINLEGWSITFYDETPSEKIFESVNIAAGEYGIICDDDDITFFEPFGIVLPISTLSDLTTTGKRLILKTSDGTIIDDLTYSNQWYDNPDKDDGGWSLERIDYMNFCGENDNWTVTSDSWGGTPGRINSVYHSNPDNTAPELTNVQLISSDKIILNFNENISAGSASVISNFTINNGIGNPAFASVENEDNTKVDLIFSPEFADKGTYQLMIENVSDNCGNITETTSFDFTYHRIYPFALWVTDEKRLKLDFSETADLTSVTDVSNYFCTKGIGNPEFAVRETQDTSIVRLQFSDNFPEGEELSLNLFGIKDINGNTMNDTSLSFYYYTPKPNDIVINEVLFNNFPDGNDFVELYNRSDYNIDLQNLQLASKDADFPDSVISISPLSEENNSFEPHTYLAFTTSKDGVLRFYMSQNEDQIYEIPDMPTYSDDLGTVVLLYKDTAIIDEFSYNENMHFPLLDDNEGVSLERVNYDKPTQDDANWHSASELVGFATPAYQNSQYNDGSSTGNSPVTVDPHVFSPDNDGFDDYANINFKFDTPDNVASVYIFDAKGRIIKKLAESLLLSTEGTVVWNGTEDNGRLAPAGTYLVYFKVFDASGNVKIYKNTVILAKKI